MKYKERRDIDLISIIIPVKNRASLIGYTLDSIFAQSYQTFEIIIVDDGSTDDLKTVLMPFQNKVIVITNEGLGPGAARNTGLNIAKGKFIKFFDSDDLMSPNSLDVQLEALRVSGKQYVTSPYIYATETNEAWECSPPLILNYYPNVTEKPLSHWMIWGLFIPIPAMLFYRSFLDQVGNWPEHIVTSEDWLYLWRMSQLEEFPAHTNKSVFIYRLHGNQSTGNNLDTLTRDKEKFEILKSIQKTFAADKKYSRWDKKVFRMKYYQMATVIQEPSFKKELLEASGKGQFFVWNYYKILMKIGRMKTTTDWQPMHGVCTDMSLVKKYLAYFKKIKSVN